MATLQSSLHLDVLAGALIHQGSCTPHYADLNLSDVSLVS